MKTIYYRLHQAIESSARIPNSVLIAEENENGGYSFYVFSSYEELKREFEKAEYGKRHPLFYHEVLVGNHMLVFDVDVDEKLYSKKRFLHPDFKHDFERIILSILREIYGDDYYRIAEMIWIDGTNPAKESHHLIVGNIIVNKIQLRQFYTILDEKLLEAEEFSYLVGKKQIVDHGLLSANHQLRLPWAVKRQKPYPLIPERDGLELADGMATYKNSERRMVLGRQLGAPIELNNRVSIMTERALFAIGTQVRTSTATPESSELSALSSYLETFADGQFSLGDNNNEFIRLVRNCPGICPIGGRSHDRSDGYAMIRDGIANFYCYRCRPGHVIIGAVGDQKQKEQSIFAEPTIDSQPSEGERSSYRTGSSTARARVVSRFWIKAKKKKLFGR